LALAVVLCGFSGCGAAEEEARIALTVNGTPLDAELFRYYLDIAFADPSLTGKEARINYATEQCIRYVAVNSAFTQRGLRLTSAERAETAQTANALWSIFGGHYKNVGVSKQAYLKIRMSLAYTERLRYALYDTGGASPLPDETLQSYFAAYYVAFKVLRGRLYGTDVYGNRVALTEEQLSALREKYRAAASQINGGVAIDFVYASLITSGNEEVRQSLTTEVISEGDLTYPQGFYGAVRGLQENKAGVMEFGDEIYLVYRVGILLDGDLFKNYRAACLAAVSEPYLQSEINQMCNGYSSVRDANVVQRCYETVKEGRKSR
jgi:hypothetical protein